MAGIKERLMQGPLRHIESVLHREKVDERALKIQRWIDYLSANPDQAKQIHNHTIELLKRYNGFPGQKTTSQENPDQRFTDAIQISNFLNNDSLDFPPFNNQNYDTKTRLDLGKIDKEKTKELTLQYAQEVLIASLFNVNRRSYGDRLNKSLEFDQIRSVAAAVIDGNHIQMGTGQGKSSVVIPISAIINSLVSEEQSSLIVSINANLVKELEDKTRAIVDSAKKSGLQLPVIAQNEHRPEEQDDGTLKKKMLADAIERGDETDFSEGVKKDLFTTYWGENIIAVSKKRKNSFRIGSLPETDDEKPKEDDPKKKDPYTYVKFMTKDDFVFQLSNKGDEFLKTCPRVYFDEIDAPYLTGETYETTQDDIFMSPQDMLESATRFTLDKMVLKILDDLDNDFEISSGAGTVKQEGIDKLSSVNWQGWVDGKEKNEKLDLALNESVKLIGNYAGLNRFGLPRLRIEIKNRIAKKLQMEDPMIEISGSADKVAEGLYSLNKIYINDGEKIVVRSEYFDQLLENHKFEPDAHLAMLAIVDKFSVVALRAKASKSIKFPTVIARLKDKLIGFSGTLIQRSLRTGKPKSSSLANILKDYTGHNVFELEPKELKSAPPPIIIKNQQDIDPVLKKQIDDSQEKPTLIVSHYDIKTTKEIYEELKTQLGDSIDILPSIPSHPNKLAEYYKNLKEKTKALADGKIKVLFSTGSVGIGADITKSDGSFPDLRVGVLGLPDNESLLRQNLGRRRMAGNNFFWIVDKTSMEERTTLLDNQSTQIIKTRLTPDKALKTISSLPLDDQDKNLEFVLRLINDADQSGRENEDKTVLYDHLYDSLIRPEAERQIRETVKTDFFDPNTDWKNDEDAKRKLEELVDIIGIPDSLYHDPSRLEVIASIQASNPKEFITKLRTEIAIRGMINSSVDEWIQMVGESAKYIQDHFFGESNSKIISINLFPIPKDSDFRPIGKVILHDSQLGDREIEIGYASTGSISPITRPSIRNPQTGLLHTLINLNFTDAKKINTIFSYRKGNDGHLFVII